MDRLAELQQKYAPMLDSIRAKEVTFSEPEVRGDRLVLKGTCGSQAILNWVLDQVDAAPEVECELKVDEALAPPTVKLYTVKEGDSLWTIAQEFLGNGALFPKIIAANPGRLKDASSAIAPGDVLRIPEM